MDIINEWMRIIELCLSILNIWAVWLMREKRILAGCICGSLGEFGWVVLFFYTGQWGIVPMEAILFLIYADYLYKYLRGRNEDHSK